MKKELATIVFIFLLTLNLLSCDYYDGRLEIINKTDETIVFEYDNDTVLEVPSVNKKEYFLSNKIEPGDTNRVVLMGSTQAWPWFVAEKPDSTLRIYVFNHDLVVNSDWDSLRANKLYKKRLDYNLDDLNSMDWKITIE